MSETIEVKEAEVVTPTPTHAGMVCFNRAGQVLVISTLNKPTTWVFPKGHIEKCETTLHAAERETLEEAGIIAVAEWPLGIYSYRHNNEDIVVAWFVGTAMARPKIEGYSEAMWRNARWLNWPDAEELLSFGDLKKLLRQALCLPLEPKTTLFGAEV